MTYVRRRFDGDSREANSMTSRSSMLNRGKNTDVQLGKPPDVQFRAGIPGHVSCVRHPTISRFRRTTRGRLVSSTKFVSVSGATVGCDCRVSQQCAPGSTGGLLLAVFSGQISNKTRAFNRPTCPMCIARHFNVPQSNRRPLAPTSPATAKPQVERPEKSSLLEPPFARPAHGRATGRFTPSIIN